MRFPVLTVAATAAAVSLLSADPAEARRGGGSSSQKMLFVADTEIVIDGKPHTLCHLVEDSGVLFVPLFRTLEGYALAENRCDTDSYYAMEPADIADAKAQGLIPADVPDEPVLSLAQKASGFWGWAIILGFVGFAGMGALKTRKRRAERQGLMGDIPPSAMAILDAMCHAAKADGHIADEEVREIAEIAERMTGQRFDPADVRRMADLAEADPSDKDVKRLTAKLMPDEQGLLMKAVLTVVASDGQLAGKEQALVGKLAGAMKMSGEQVSALLAEVVGAQQQPQG